MNYKLINKLTGEEHICQKVTIDGFDYYVSDEKPQKGDWFISLPRGTLHKCAAIFEGNLIDNTWEDRENVEITKSDCKKVIATNNPNIDIPKVVCNIDLTKLCYYDRRNPDFSIKEEYGYDKEEVEATGNFAKKDCACDNCFYGRSQLTEQLIKSQETHPFSEEDMIEFAKWSNRKEDKSKKELLQLWREQKPKIVYYEGV